MALQDRPIDEVTEADLQALVTSAVAESRDIDFKVEGYGANDEQKREYLADLSSFANTAGGHLVVGIREAGGIAQEVVGIDGDRDQICLRLEQLARDGLDPRIEGLRIRSVPLANGRFAIVARVPRSWNPPHRIIANRSFRFFARGDGGKYEPDVEQLRSLFSIAPRLADQIRDWRLDRVVKIAGGQTPVPVRDKTALIFHAIPFASFGSQIRISIDDLLAATTIIAPMQARGWETRINLDGVISISNPIAETHPAYAQVWRSGQIENIRAPLVTIHGADRLVIRDEIGRNIISGATSALTILKHFQIPPPFILMASAVGVRGAHLNKLQEEIDAPSNFDRDIVLTSEVVIRDAVNDDRQIPGLVRPMLNEIANAGGLRAL